MLPLSSEHYEQESDNTLRIRSVTLSNLGVYTCHAFNGIGKPAEWSTTLQAIGPVANIRADQEQYRKYLVQAPQRPERPSYPYRPNRTQTHENQTYAPIYTTRQYNIPGVVPINITTTTPAVDYSCKYNDAEEKEVLSFRFKMTIIRRDRVRHDRYTIRCEYNRSYIIDLIISYICALICY